MKKIASLIFILIMTMQLGAFADEGKLGFLENYFEITEINIPDGYEIIGIGSEYLTLKNDLQGIRIADMNGNFTTENDLDFEWVGSFYEGIAPAKKFSFGNGGFINIRGEFVIPPLYERTDNFSCGYAIVSKNGCMGFVDTKGNLVKIFDENTSLNSFMDGMATVCIHDEEGGKSTVYDTSFNELFTVDKCDWISYRGEGVFCCTFFENEKFMSRCYDKNGKALFTTEGDIGEFYGGRTICMTEENVLIIDKEGNTVSKAVRENDKWATRCADNLNYTVAYDEDFSNLIFCDDSFTETGSLENAYIYRYDSCYLVLNDYEDGKTYILKDKNYKEQSYTLPENPITYQFSDKNAEKTETELKIGDSRAFINGNSVFIDWADTAAEMPVVFIKDGRTMVPIRFINEAFANYGDSGYYIDYYDESRSVILEGERRIEMQIDSNIVKITEFDADKNEYAVKNITMDTAPVIQNNRTFVPIRFISEILGYKVDYADGTVLISNSEDSVLDSAAVNAKFAEARYTLQNYPVIDGSTATLPLSYALTAKMLGISEQQASEITHHSKTENAYNRLISGEADMLITGAPNAERIAKAAEQGVTFETYDFALDGFVFMVNKENTVTNLSTEQIQDIYQGKITNWKEVGGENAEIVPFQRNEDSGSQAHMRNDFMKGMKMIDPKTLRINAMGEIIDMVAEYDNAKDSIGYTVYYYLSKMYERDEVKAIGVDGVIPTDETIRTGEYPYIIRYSIVIRSDEPADSEVRKIIEFLKSEEGRQLVKDAGFVSVE